MVRPDKLKDVARGILDGAHSPNENSYKAEQIHHHHQTAAYS
jgi:hypothetical protein